jgi:hypothetical protein
MGLLVDDGAIVQVTVRQRRVAALGSTVPSGGDSCIRTTPP